MPDEGVSVVASLRGTCVTRLHALRAEVGFTLIEVLLAGVMLAIIAAPITSVLASGAVISRLARERTGADQLAQTQIETIRTLGYTQVGIVGGNPPGNLAASTSTTLPSGEAVTVKTQVTWVADQAGAYATNADYKKVVLTVTRNSDGKQLSQKTTYVASASAPPLSGTSWVQIKRTVVDAVLASPLVGASVHLTGGPSSEDRTDTTDGSGTVLFPALNSSPTSLPVYTLATSSTGGYYVFPDDISPGSASSIPSTPGLNSIGVIRMYLPTSLTVNVQNSSGAPYTGGATVWLDSSRCGQTAIIPNLQSSTIITSCNYATNKNVLLPPNVLGQTPLFDKYYVTANSGSNWSPGVAVSVPLSYPTTLTQSVTVKFSATTYSTTKAIKVTVTKGGVGDSNARVEVTGTPTGISSALYFYGTTDGSGIATFNVPFAAAGTAYTVNANDMGAAKGTASTTISSGSGATTSVPVTIS